MCVVVYEVFVGFYSNVIWIRNFFVFYVFVIFGFEIIIKIIKMGRVIVKLFVLIKDDCFCVVMNNEICFI